LSPKQYQLLPLYFLWPKLGTYLYKQNCHKSDRVSSFPLAAGGDPGRCLSTPQYVNGFLTCETGARSVFYSWETNVQGTPGITDLSVTAGDGAGG